MKPNFHAIDAIAFGLRYGFTGLGTALRLGWVSAALILGAFYYFYVTADSIDAFSTSYLFSQFSAALADQFVSQLSAIFPALSDVTVTVDDEIDLDPEEVKAIMGSIGVLYGGMLVGFILFIPALVAMIREGAGLEARSGFLPAFGREEWSFVAAYLILGLLFVAIYIGALIGLIPLAIVAESGGIEAGPLFTLAALVVMVLVFWFSIRIQLFPAHAAITGTINLGQAFGITSGRFWKLLGTVILFGLIIQLISCAATMLVLPMQAMGTETVIGASIFVTLLVQLYMVTAQSAFYGRITGELMGTFDDETGGHVPFDDVDDIEDFADATDAVDLDDDQPISTMAAESSSVPMMRSAFASTDAASDNPPLMERGSEPDRKASSSVQFIRSRFR